MEVDGRDLAPSPPVLGDDAHVVARGGQHPAETGADGPAGPALARAGQPGLEGVRRVGTRGALAPVDGAPLGGGTGGQPPAEGSHHGERVVAGPDPQGRQDLRCQGVVDEGVPHRSSLHSENTRLTTPSTGHRSPMIVLGLILLLLGLLLDVGILYTLGVILLIVGAVLAVLGATGRAVGGRRHWF